MYSILLRNSGLRRLASQFHCKSRFYTYSLYLIGEHDLCHKVLKVHVVIRSSRPIFKIRNRWKFLYFKSSKKPKYRVEYYIILYDKLTFHILASANL